MKNVVTLNDHSRSALLRAIEDYVEDQKTCLFHENYGENWPVVADAKADILSQLAGIMDQIGSHAFGDDIRGLSESFREAQIVSGDNAPTLAPHGVVL